MDLISGSVNAQVEVATALRQGIKGARKYTFSAFIGCPSKSTVVRLCSSSLDSQMERIMTGIHEFILTEVI